MKTAVVLALAGAAISAPTRTLENRQFSGLSSGSGTESGLDALKSLIPSGIPSFPHFSGLPGLGGSGGSSSGLPSLPSFSDLPSLGGSGDLPSLPTGLPSLSDLEGSSAEGEATKTEKRQFSGLGSGSGDLSSFESLIPSLGGSSTSGGGLSALESLIPSSGSTGGGLSSLIPSLGGSSTSGGGLSALESLLPSAGSSTGLGFKARRDAEIEKRQLSTLTSLFPTLSSSSSGSDSTSSSSDSSSGSGFSIPGLSNISDKNHSNGVTSNTGCQELTFIFARGTGELGNMGSVVGPEVATQLKSLTSNKVTIQGVTYSADAAGNAQLGANGGPIMAKLVKQALSQCPNTKVVVGGYSQGAMVVHNAASSLSSGQISGAVLFGDPFKAQAVSNLSDDKRKEFCATGDPVCENGFNVMAHLTYGSDAKTAAQFLVSAAGLS
ncbi:uncharacterized protein N7529_008222 [Penicillium soppii]|uniref:uncharacterized protein n=1 Tax=Penicillium soppii TaxID=69789 RepID=UPI002548B1F2|nr:uncharacterized protein N7529_008222 [Penicillium soppii]KAJ5860912.1 hypothetical protein N7529_008222 [Penicillium soppii]